MSSLLDDAPLSSGGPIGFSPRPHLILGRSLQDLPTVSWLVRRTGHTFIEVAFCGSKPGGNQARSSLGTPLS